MQVPAIPLMTREELDVMTIVFQSGQRQLNQLVSDLRLYGAPEESQQKFIRRKEVADALFQRMFQLRLAIPSVIIDVPSVVVRETQEPQEPNGTTTNQDGAGNTGDRGAVPAEGPIQADQRVRDGNPANANEPLERAASSGGEHDIHTGQPG